MHRASLLSRKADVSFLLRSTKPELLNLTELRDVLLDLRWVKKVLSCRAGLQQFLVFFCFLEGRGLLRHNAYLFSFATHGLKP